ncbi:MAG: AAA family ATPase [Solobacterium sp.]|nr:AAA family ATPase [Solobacterium sp.]
MTQQIILLNGPSSSGKSTLARALQTLISDKCSERYEIVSIDDFLKMSPEEPIYEDDVFEISDDLCSKVQEITNAGTGVIVDHVITSERIFEHLKNHLTSSQIRLVRISCPLRLLRERELARGNRHPGSAEASEEYLFPKNGYDLTVDTGSKSPAENALLIFETFF